MKQSKNDKNAKLTVQNQQKNKIPNKEISNKKNESPKSNKQKGKENENKKKNVNESENKKKNTNEGENKKKNPLQHHSHLLILPNYIHHPTLFNINRRIPYILKRHHKRPLHSNQLRALSNHIPQHNT
jgi:hypothetical protein